MSTDAYEQPTMACPRCGEEFEDFDGVGVTFCANCRYCRHVDRGGDDKGNMVCRACGDVEAA